MQRVVAGIISEALDRSPKMLKDIAAELGYPNANIITMFRKGATKVPIDKAPALANALGLEPSTFLREVLTEYAPNLLQALEGVHGRLPSPNEVEILDAIRTGTAQRDPPLRTTEQQLRLASLCQALVPELDPAWGSRS